MRLLRGRGGGGSGQGGQGGYAGHHRHYHHYLQIHQIHNHDHDHLGYNVLITLTIRMSDPRCLFSRLTVANRDSKTSLVFRWLIQILMICIAIMIILMVIIISLICP